MCKFLPLSHENKSDRLEKFDTMVPDIPVGIKRDKLLDNVLLLAQSDLFIGGNTDFFHFAVAQGVPSIGLFSEQEDAAWIPTAGEKVQVIIPAKGKGIDLDSLSETVKAVSGGLVSTQSTVIPPNEVASLENKSTFLAEESGDND